MPLVIVRAGVVALDGYAVTLFAAVRPAIATEGALTVL
jgi:hypothetical protein